MPVMVASENGRRGMLAAMALLREGGSALDAVELASRIVEDDPDDHSVGYSGLPNVLGEVELDASIMDGATLRAGAVAAVQGYGRAITLARRVMEETPHVLVVARGAERLAAELGEPPQDQRTEEALRRWRERFAERDLTPGATENLRSVARTLTRPLNLQGMINGAARVDTLGTVDFIALDRRGNLASAVSTSGLGWKYPGRVGDSPLIGAGNYCDNRYGAAACTGMGELAIRVSTARSLVLYIKCGMSLVEAGREALRDLLTLDATEGQYMNIVTLTPAGDHAGFTTVPGKQYLFQRAEMDEPQLAERLMVE
ncbi:MAG: isoaspartyl peptidase/L-asparaginase [Caldilinea sp.]